jgi:hypothetical protein
MGKWLKSVSLKRKQEDNISNLSEESEEVPGSNNSANSVLTNSFLKG